MKCQEVRKFIDAFVDQELEPRQALLIEEHVGSCEACRTRVAVTKRLKQEIQARHQPLSAPDHLRRRVDETVSRRRIAILKPWIAAPLAAAAAALLALALLYPRVHGQETAAPMDANAEVSDMIRPHLVSLPLDIRDSNHRAVGEWFKGKVNFPVRPPAFKTARASLVGGRVSHVTGRQAAQLKYDVDGKDVAVTIFHPERPVTLPQATLETTSGRKIHLTRINGVTVALFDDSGVTYAVTGDLQKPQLLKLVSSLEP